MSFLLPSKGVKEADSRNAGVKEVGCMYLLLRTGRLSCCGSGQEEGT